MPFSARSKTALLATGDIVALLLFAAAGRVNHGEVLDAETLTTALPFIIGERIRSARRGFLRSNFRVGWPAKAIPIRALRGASLRLVECGGGTARLTRFDGTEQCARRLVLHGTVPGRVRGCGAGC